MKEFQYRREQLRNSIARVHKKWTLYQRASNEFSTALQDLEKRVESLDNIWVSLEDSVTRVANRVNKELTRENTELKRLVKLKEEIDHQGIAIGSTWAVFSFLFDHISDNNSDIRMVLESAVFASVFVPLMEGNTDLIVDTLPSQLNEIVYEGRELVKLALEEAERTFSLKEVWDEHAPFIQEWVRDNLIPVVLGNRVEQHPFPVMSYEDMILWREIPSERDEMFPEIFDMYEIYRQNKVKIFEELGLAFAERQLREFLYEDN
jgi:exonuclease VII small subunit